MKRRTWIILMVGIGIFFGAITFTIVKQYLTIQELREELRWEKAKLEIIYQDPRVQEILESGG